MFWDVANFVIIVMISPIG